MRKCPEPWLDTYVEYTKEQESPKTFNLMTGVAILSSAIGRNVWLPRIKYTIYPNVYVILIAESSKCRKSVALGIGEKILRAMAKPPIIFAQKLTPEALIDAITSSTQDNQSFGLVYSDELSVLLSADAIKRGIIPVLTTFYDSHSKWEYHTKAKGIKEIRNSSLALLAATTRDDFIRTMPRSAIGGGFTSRLVLVYEERPSHLKLFNVETPSGAEIEETEHERILRELLVQDLNHIKDSVKGQLRFSKPAKNRAKVWYESEHDIIRDSNTDGYFGRKHDTMFKLASILCVSDGDRLVIEESHIMRALKILEVVEDNMTVLVGKIGTTETGTLAEKVLVIIARSPGIPYSSLLRKCWRFASAQELSAILTTLTESGEIVEKIDGRVRTYAIPDKL